MAQEPEKPTINFLDADGLTYGKMTLYGVGGTIGVLDDDSREIAWSGESDGSELSIELQRVQLLEGRRYDYLLEDIHQGLQLDHERNPCIIPHRQNPRFGHLEPGTYTGLLELQLKNGAGDTVASACVEVQSSKAGSLRHYVTMLDDIAGRSNELLMQATSPVQARFDSFGEEDAQTLTQRFFFLEALLGKRSFLDALERIIRNPHIRSTGKLVEKNLTRGGFPVRADELRQIASRYPRTELPSDHPLRLKNFGLKSVPLAVMTREHGDFIDTPENRFIKHALHHFMYALEEISEILRAKSTNKEHGDSQVANRAAKLTEILEERLSHSFFRELSPPAFLPLGSPVLQRKEGYREVLVAWLKFDLASQLVWKGGDNVFGAGKRDVAKLYEFWLCFKLEEAVGQIFRMDKTPELIKPTENGLELTLEAGKSLDWKGQYLRNNTPRLNMRFSFNRTFSGQGSSPRAEHGSHTNYGLGKEGAWTAQMRPDYTITLWPINMQEEIAEKEEQIVHLHFDAKYRVQSVNNIKGSPVNILDLFSDQKAKPATDEDAELAESAGLGDEGDQGVEEQERAEIEGRLSKRADLLKMHAYRDAIRRSEGAYVLYPGTHEKRWAAYHELLPGIGAFPVCPGSNEDMNNVADFLKQAADLCVDRFSQLHRQRYWTENIMAEEPGSYIADAQDTESELPPADETVIVGYIRREALQQCKNERVFFFHALYEDGTTPQVDPGVFAPRVFVPYQNLGPVGWYATVESCELVDRKTMESRVGEDALGKHKNGKKPTYYYLLVLKEILEHLPNTDQLWKSLIESERGDPGAPFTCNWAKLWKKSD